MLKMALFDCAINEKCCSVDGGRGICPLFSSPPRGVWQLKSPHPREFAIQVKKMLMPGGQPGWVGAGRRWNWLMHNQFSQNSVWIANTSRCTGPVRIATRYNVRKINKDNLHYINIWDQKVQNSVFYEAFLPIIWIVNVWNQMSRVSKKT